MKVLPCLYQCQMCLTYAIIFILTKCLLFQVETLINIPEPVLRGVLDKFKRDEEQEVRRLKNK